MRWIIQWHEDYTVLRFEGDLMVGATLFFENGVMPWLNATFGPIVLDLSDLKIIASAGLSTLLKIRQAADEAEVHVVVVKPSYEAWQTLEITNLTRMFPFAESLDQAIATATDKRSR